MSNINVYDEIFSPYYFTQGDFDIKLVRKLVTQCISKKLIGVLGAMARHNYVTAKNRDVKDTKANMIIMRCFLEAKYVLQHKAILMNVPKLLDSYTFTSKDREIFKLFLNYKILNKKLSTSEANMFKEWIKNAEAQITQDIADTSLPSKPSKKAVRDISDYIFEVRVNNSDFFAEAVFP
jgi:hypothetical protein